ncbi:permease-like cell division protein FtsX [uncultured Fretibacterium sp.]|uniref:cell division protein FtsX n=1 Tax=uncultured Fretibacterium sp. TaxID=1678694 RepID=UPI00261C7A40|nr:permease-like cell division protein FtsX [uncultured Fretibacterium sp.]
MTTFKYILRDMGRLLVHHWILGLLTLITASVMLWILGLTTLFSLNIRTFLSQLESELVVQVFLKKGSEVERVAGNIRSMPSVADLQAFSPDESLVRLQTKMGSQSRALDLMGTNPIPWNFKVRVRSARDVEPLVRTLMSMPEVDDVVYAGMVVQRVSALSHVAARIALLMFALSVVVTSLVVYNTIHISLYSRREEISIMYLVGATRSYIATPFVLEGTFLVLLGALIAVTGIVATYLPGIRILQENLPFLTLASDSRLIGRFCILLIGFGATLGWVCSCIVVARFMHSATSPE